MRARAEAARQGSRTTDAQHLALALADAGALELDADAARRSLPSPACNAPQRAGLHPSLHARLVRSTGVLELGQLVHATLEDPDTSGCLTSSEVNGAADSTVAACPPVAPRSGLR